MNSSKHGFTMVEMMIAAALLTVVMGIFFTVLISFSSAAQVQESRISVDDASRQAMQAMVQELRQAQLESIEPVGGAYPTDAIRYKIVADADGNGVPLKSNGDVELSRARTMGPDTRDRNRDGFRGTQLIRTEAGSDAVRVLTSNLADQEGIRFELVGGGIRITLICQDNALAAQGRQPLFSTQTETVAPRN